MSTDEFIVKEDLGLQSYDNDDHNDDDNENIPTENVILKREFSSKGAEVASRKLECISPLGVLIDNSRQWANENQQNFTPTSKGGGNRVQSLVATRKKEVPLLERLRVIKASGCSGSTTPQKPLPEEVIVDNDDDILRNSTLLSELGVDGLASVCTAEKRRPMTFTFDGVVPSRSSLDEYDSPPEHIYPMEPSDSVQQGFGVSKILDGLEYEPDDNVGPVQRVEPSGLEYEPEDNLGPAQRVEPIISTCLLESTVKARERCPSTATTSSEMSIELSVSQYLRNCEVDKKYLIFSPHAQSVANGEESPIDHGFDVIINSCSIVEKEKDTGSEEKATSSPWINLSFLGIW